MITHLRDPRVMPRTGDILWNMRQEYRVEMYNDGKVYYSIGGKITHVPVQDWRGWMESAIILEKGGSHDAAKPPADFNFN